MLGKVIFIEHDQTEHVAEFEAGSSVMQIAVDNAIPGIDGDCGESVLVVPATSSSRRIGSARQVRLVMRKSKCCQ